MIITTRGKKTEIFEFDDFKDYLSDYNYNENDALNYFIKNKNNTIQKSKLPFKKKSNNKVPKKPLQKITKTSLQNNTKPKNKSGNFIETSPCKERTLQYLDFTKRLIKSLSQPTMKFKKSVFYYCYLKDYNYYALVIQDRGKKFYFEGYDYEIIDKMEDYFYTLFYIKITILKKYFSEREILKINDYCYFEGFKNKVINKLPKEPLFKIDYMEELK